MHLTSWAALSSDARTFNPRHRILKFYPIFIWVVLIIITCIAVLSSFWSLLNLAHSTKMSISPFLEGQPVVCQLTKMGIGGWGLGGWSHAFGEGRRSKSTLDLESIFFVAIFTGEDCISALEGKRKVNPLKKAREESYISKRVSPVWWVKEHIRQAIVGSGVVCVRYVWISTHAVNWYFPSKEVLRKNGWGQQNLRLQVYSGPWMPSSSKGVPHHRHPLPLFVRGQTA